jgi:hypothetical protein
MSTISQTPRSSTTLSLRTDQVTSKPTTPISSSQKPASDRTAIFDAPPCPNQYAVTKESSIDWNDARNNQNPFNWPHAKKWRVTLLASFMTFVIQVNGTMMTSAAEQINESFHVSDETFPHSYWPVLSWNLGGAAAPLVGLPLMENFGVRRSYMVGQYAMNPGPTE